MASNPNNSNPACSIGGSPLGNAGMSVTAAAQLHRLRPPPAAGSAFHGQFLSSAKRPPQKFHDRLPPAAPAPAFRASELTPAARRKKRKLPEKIAPRPRSALLPESALHTQRLEFESRVDAALARKKIDIQESVKTLPTLQRTLRIYVSTPSPTSPSPTGPSKASSTIAQTRPPSPSHMTPPSTPRALAPRPPTKASKSSERDPRSSPPTSGSR